MQNFNCTAAASENKVSNGLVAHLFGLSSETTTLFNDYFYLPGLKQYAEV